VSGGEFIRAVLRAVHAGDDPYAHTDLRMATRLGGALFLIGIAYVVIVLPLSMPGHWGVVAGCLVVAVFCGVRLLNREEPAAPNMLLAYTYLGVGMATTYRWAAGPAAPFHELLFLIALYAAAVHPPLRALLVLTLATGASLSPLLYGTTEGQFAAEVAGHLALMWSLGIVVLIWVIRNHNVRRELAAAREAAEESARLDVLTGLGNRRALEEELPRAVAAARRQGHALSVLVADLDAFKQANDTFGHLAGDDLLRGASRALTAAVRMPDPCFRWGGDEFVALLPGAGRAEADLIAERVAHTVAVGVSGPDGEPLRITIGVAELREGETGAEMTARADAELLRAKNRRRPARASA
jgi:diguanylate cyclase (GGDEF)-like protein